MKRFTGVVPLETLKATKGLESMVVTQKGSRLSVQPVTKAEWDIVVRLGEKTVAAPSAATKSTKKRHRAPGQ